MTFKKNRNGGWIVPAETVIGGSTAIPAYSELHAGCTLGNHCTLGDWCKLGNHCMLGDWCKLGSHCTLGDSCRLGDYCTLGHWCTLGDCCKLGDCCQLGNHCTLEGLLCRRFMNLSNVDGSGRQILLVTDGKKVLVRAGCFLGSPKEFCAKAEKGKKSVYADTVRAVAAIPLKHA